MKMVCPKSLGPKIGVNEHDKSHTGLYPRCCPSFRFRILGLYKDHLDEPLTKKIIIAISA